MRSRQEIKAYAKQAFSAQYGSLVLALFLVMLVAGVFSLFYALGMIMSTFASTGGYSISAMTTMMIIGLIASILSIPLVLLLLVLDVNIRGVYIKAFYNQRITGTEPYSMIKHNFGRKLGGMCWASLWTYLWTLVGFFALYIPTVIKILAYSMTSYILAAHPNVKATDAIKLSMRMTKGHKGKLFVLSLSFLGWNILDALTLGVLGILYVNPYMYMTYTGFFIELRNQAISSGVIHPSELDGVAAYYPQNPCTQQPSQQAYEQQHPYATAYAPQPQYPSAPPPGSMPPPQYPLVPPSGSMPEQPSSEALHIPEPPPSLEPPPVSEPPSEAPSTPEPPPEPPLPSG